MMQATTGWLETYSVPHTTTRNTILCLEKQVLWRHGTLERIESDNGTHFCNSLIDTWAKEHGIEWVVSHPLPLTSLWKDRAVQWAAKNHFESNAGWEFQKLGYSFSKGHLVG